MPLNDPVSHYRESLLGWITSAPEGEIRALMKVRRNLDGNLKKPAQPAGWRQLKSVAIEAGLHIAHLARLCRDLYAAQDLARICTHRGRQTWCIAPAAVAQICANRPLSGEGVRERSTSQEGRAAGADERQPSANRGSVSADIAQNVRTGDGVDQAGLEPASSPVPTACDAPSTRVPHLQTAEDIRAQTAPICKLPIAAGHRS